MRSLARFAPLLNPRQGTKYIVDDIVFKVAFPADDSPYLGSNECANKAAGHDLRGAISISHSIEDENNDDGKEEVINVNCSMMAVIDHLGSRVTVMTLLDLDKGSLKVGSADACTTVPHGNLDETERTVNRNMNTVAQRMGLAVHEVKVDGNTVQMGFGADVEAHLDRHGIGRVLDTARVFPPESYSVTTVQTFKAGKSKGKKKLAKCFPHCPAKDLKGKEKKKACTCAPTRELLPSVPGNVSIYWRLLRPELLLLLKDKEEDGLLKDQEDRLYDDDLDATGLSSDGFSRFAEKGVDRLKHDARIGVATTFMMEVQVPKVASALAARPNSKWWDGAGMTAIFHRLGVNMRHAGAVWILLNSKCKELAKELKKAETELKKKELENELKENKSARRGVVQEMFTRTAKNLLRRDLRGALEMGAGVYEIGQVRCLISSMKRGWGSCLRAFAYSCWRTFDCCFLRVLFGVRRVPY